MILLRHQSESLRRVIAVLALDSVGTFLLAVKSKMETKEMLTDSVDAIALVGHVVSELSALRREQLKPSLQPEFHTKCANNTTTTSNLILGDDLAKQFSTRRRRTPWQNGGWPILQTLQKWITAAFFGQRPPLSGKKETLSRQERARNEITASLEKKN